VSRPVSERLLVAVNDPTLTIDRQAFGGDGRGGHLKMRLSPLEHREEIDAIAFGQQADALPRSGPARLLYRLDVNRFRGHESSQLMVERIVRSDS
jgi:hypothetical protein